MLNFKQITNSPLFGDDWPNSFNGYWANYFYSEVGIKAFLIDTILWSRAWTENFGRFYPLGIATGKIFILFESIESYKIYQFALLIIFLFLFYYFLTLITKNLVFSSLNLLILNIVIRIRSDFDPVIGYGSIIIISAIQILLLLIATELIINRKYDKQTAIVIYIFVLIAGLLTYEYFLIGIFCSILRIAMQKKNRFNTKFIFFLGSFLTIYVIMLLTFRSTREYFNPKYEFSLNLTRVISVYIKQSIAAIPASQELLTLSNLKSIFDFKATLFLGVMAILLSICVILLRSKALIVDGEKYILIVGLVWLMIPPLIMAVSKFWQENLIFGDAYIPIFYQYVGLSILITLFCRFIFKSPGVSYLTMSGLTVIIISILGLNTYIINQENLKNDEIIASRFDFLKSAIDYGLFNRAGNHIAILSNQANDTTELNRAVISTLSGKNVTRMEYFTLQGDRICDRTLECKSQLHYNRTTSTSFAPPPGTSLLKSIYLKAPTEGVSDYNGNRIIIDEDVQNYVLDAIHLGSEQVLFLLAELIYQESTKEFKIRDVTLMWIKKLTVKESPGKVLENSSCIYPKEFNFDSNSGYAYSVLNVNGDYLPLTKLQIGGIC